MLKRSSGKPWQGLSFIAIEKKKTVGTNKQEGVCVEEKKVQLMQLFFFPTLREHEEKIDSQAKARLVTHYVIFFLPPESHLCVCQQLFFLRRNSQIKAGAVSDVTRALLIKEFCCNCRGIPVFV